jgi:hypothetical protein
MLITRVSPVSGQTNERDIPVTQEQLDNYYLNNYLAQLAFPNLSADEREFIKTGITSEEWDNLFGEDCFDPEGIKSPKFGGECYKKECYWHSVTEPMCGRK